MLKGRSQFLKFTLVVGLALSLLACGPSDSSTDDTSYALASSCQIQPDQRGTFMARVRGFPIRIQADEEFDSTQREALAQAVASWNALGRDLIHSDLFELQSVSIPGRLRRLNPQACGQDYGSPETLPILQETSYSHWKILDLDRQIPAVTVRCTRDHRVSEQMILVYTRLLQPSSYLNVFTHELGHAIGLDHSCADGGQASNSGFVSCSKLPANSPYREAVMAPWVKPDTFTRFGRFGTPPKYGMIRSNDIIRANCLLNAP